MEPSTVILVCNIVITLLYTAFTITNIAVLSTLDCDSYQIE